MEFDKTSNSVIRAAITVHSILGPGLFEQVYKTCLLHELTKQGLSAIAEVGIPVTYDGIKLNLGYRADLLVENSLIVELKSVENLTPLHTAQLSTYLKLAQKPVGLILNFNTYRLKDGLIRIVNSPPTSRSSRSSR